MSYNKKIWANGDLITKERMNNIEDGIYDAHDKIDAINNKVEENTTDTNTARQDISDIKLQIGTEELTTTSKKIKGAINDLSSQIKDIENKKLNKDGVIHEVNLGQDVLEKMTGGSVAVVDVNSVGIQNLNDNIVKNISDYKDATNGYTWSEGYYHYINKTIEGGSPWKTIEIPCGHGDRFRVSGTCGGDSSFIAMACVLDSTGNIIDKIENGSYENKEYSIPHDGIKIIFVWNTNLGTYKIEKLEVENIVEKINTLENKITDEMLDSISFYCENQNLIFSSGYYNYSANEIQGGDPWIYTYINASKGDKIKITGGSGGGAHNIRQIVELDDIGNQTGYYLEGQVNYFNHEYIVQGENTSKIIVTFNTNINPDYKIETLGYNLKSYLDDNIPKKKYAGKKISTLGDSITGMGKWQPFLSQYYECKIDNCGIGGATMSYTIGINDVHSVPSLTTDNMINNIDTDTDCILVMAGANDFGREIPLGTMADTGTDTFYGAVKTVINKLITKFPTTRIIFMTTPFRLRQTTVENHINLTIQDYNDVTRNVCKYYHMPYIELSNNVGFNEYNYTTYMMDDVHPNEVGGKRMSEIIIPNLELL